MTVWKLQWTHNLEQVRRFAESRDLTVMDVGLASLPGGEHWHMTRPGVRGVLELSWWPHERSFWLSVHANREAEWIIEDVEAFLSEFGPAEVE